MAMTKAERDKVATLEAELLKARALGWRHYPPAEMIPAPKHGEPATRGYLMNVHRGEVTIWFAASKWHSHMTSHAVNHVAKWAADDLDYGGSKGAVAIFPTRLSALRAARLAAQEEAAASLARIDWLISACEAEEDATVKAWAVEP